MKFYDLLVLMDDLSDIIIYIEEEEEPVFNGIVMDVPWIYAKMYIDKEGLEDGCAGISARSYGNGRSGFIVALKEEE